jgi:hypothetical protein
MKMSVEIATGMPISIAFEGTSNGQPIKVSMTRT